MSDKIKPSEVSQVLLDQLKGISDDEKFDEVGTVLTVSDGVARIYGLRNVEASELLEFENGTMAIVMNLEEDNVGCVLLGTTSGIKRQRRLCASGYHFGHQGRHGGEAHQAHCFYPCQRQYARTCHQPAGTGYRRQGRH